MASKPASAPGPVNPAQASSLRADVSVLYCDPRGPYPQLVADWWDERRDARNYAGPNPIVAHPPCGAWGMLRHLYRRDDGDLAPLAVEQVRRWGGVLEHPAHSRLWDHCQLPPPGDLPDAFGGYSVEVCQCDWGHVARKRTWLYLVGVQRSALQWPAHREPTHWASGGRTTTGHTPVPDGIKVASAQQRRRTPVDFARYLIDLAALTRAQLPNLAAHSRGATIAPSPAADNRPSALASTDQDSKPRRP